MRQRHALATVSSALHEVHDYRLSGLHAAALMSSRLAGLMVDMADELRGVIEGTSATTLDAPLDLQDQQHHQPYQVDQQPAGFEISPV